MSQSLFEDQERLLNVEWCGWWRSSNRSPWRLICSDPDESRCRQKLHDKISGGDFLLRAPGRGNPNEDEP